MLIVVTFLWVFLGFFVCFQFEAWSFQIVVLLVTLFVAVFDALGEALHVELLLLLEAQLARLEAVELSVDLSDQKQEGLVQLQR